MLSDLCIKAHNETAGFMCAPDIMPKHWTIIITMSPKASEAKSSDEGLFQLITLAHPKRTRNAVPSISAKQRAITLTVFTLKPKSFYAYCGHRNQILHYMHC